MIEEDFFKALEDERFKKAGRILKVLQKDLPRKRALYLEGMMLEEMGEYKEALKKFDMALVLHLSDMTLWLSKARVLMELGRLDMAKRAADRACRLSHDDGEPHLLFAEILYRMKEYENAMEQIDLAISNGTGTAEALTLKGILISIIDQDYREALKFFDSAIGSDENHGRAWTNRGMALIQIGDRDGAVYSFQKAITLDMKDQNAKKMLEKLGFSNFVRSLEGKVKKVEAEVIEELEEIGEEKEEEEDEDLMVWD
jgi:tetratricopeptide (TPR) repeat protein